MKTIIQFDLFKADEKSFFTDPTSMYIKGYFNWVMVNELLTDEEAYLSYLGEDLKVGEMKTVTLEIWEDSDDYRSWLDYKELPTDFEVEA
jgi:hypothetical protein